MEAGSGWRGPDKICPGRRVVSLAGGAVLTGAAGEAGVAGAPGRAVSGGVGGATGGACATAPADSGGRIAFGKTAGRGGIGIDGTLGLPAASGGRTGATGGRTGAGASRSFSSCGRCR